MQQSRILSRGDVHLLIAGIFFGTFVLVRLTDPSDYGMTLHPRLDKVWTISRIGISAGWMVVALLLATFVKKDATLRSLEYGSAAAAALGLITLSIFFPQSSSLLAILGSLGAYAATSGLLCLKIQKPLAAALLGGVFFVLQILTDGVVHFMNGAIRIH